MWTEVRAATGDAAAVAGKDLRIEWRARAALGQVLPFALLVLVLFGFALNANRPALKLATPGLFWMAALFVTVVAVQRSTSVEATDSAGRMLLLSGMSPAAAFAGKAAAVTVQLLVVEVALVVGVVVLYEASVQSPLMLLVAAVAASVGLACAGSLLGAVVAGTRSNTSVLSILLLPVAAPVLIAATRAFDDALGVVAVNGWAWVGLLAGFAAVNATLGAVCYGALLEDS